jgi:hypothetical protein
MATAATDTPRAHRDRDRQQHDHEQRGVVRRLVEDVPDYETEHAKGADRVDDLPPRCNLPVLSYESHGQVSISPSATHVPSISCPSGSVATRPYTHRAPGYWGRVGQRHTNLGERADGRFRTRFAQVSVDKRLDPGRSVMDRSGGTTDSCRATRSPLVVRVVGLVTMPPIFGGIVTSCAASVRVR